MKKIMALLLFIAGSTQLKAQQIHLAPNGNFNNGFQKNYFNSDSLKKPELIKPGTLVPLVKFDVTSPGNIVYSTMPVAKNIGLIFRAHAGCYSSKKQR